MMAAKTEIRECVVKTLDVLRSEGLGMQARVEHNTQTVFSLALVLHRITGAWGAHLVEQKALTSRRNTSLPSSTLRGLRLPAYKGED